MTDRNNGSAAALALLATLALSSAGPAAAQQDPGGGERERRAAELQVERERRAAELQVERHLRAAETQAERGAVHAEARAERIELQLREAEKQLSEAAARVAELSRQRLPDVTMVTRHLRVSDRPVLGVTIGDGGEDGPVEGVTVRGVTPGSAAEDAGLRTGDVLTAVNDESLSADTQSEANEKLLELMDGVEEGDTLEIEYLRDGRSDTVQVEPRDRAGFSVAFDDRSWHVPFAPAAPGARVDRWFGFHGAGRWGDMEMVSLTEELGRYFGTDQGLLVVRAPEDDSLKLQDGDVIQSIDGRKPQSASHAMRILASYQGGETLTIEIMRDKQRETLQVEMPDNRRGFRWRHGSGMPLVRPAPAPLIVPAAAPRIEVRRYLPPPGERI